MSYRDDFRGNRETHGSRVGDPLREVCPNSHTQRMSARLKNYRTVVKEWKPLRAAVSWPKVSNSIWFLKALQSGMKIRNL